MSSRVIGTLLILMLLAASGGCVHPCLALAEEMCECEETEGEREVCKRQARRIFDQAPSSDTKEARATCSELLSVCDCEKIATERGKRECGLAIEP